jgi:hypothetical protein
LDIHSMRIYLRTRKEMYLIMDYLTTDFYNPAQTHLKPH